MQALLSSIQNRNKCLNEDYTFGFEWIVFYTSVSSCLAFNLINLPPTGNLKYILESFILKRRMDGLFIS